MNSDMVPEGWIRVSLSELGRFLSGGTPRTSDSRFWGGDLPWVSSKDMKVLRLSDAIDHVTQLAVGNGTRLIQPGTILMVVRGMSLANSFPVAIADRPLTFNQDIKALVTKSGIQSEFVLRWLEGNQGAILQLATDSTHGTKRIPTGDLLHIKITLPPPTERCAIAAALSDVDEFLWSLEALIKKKRAIKQAAMQQLLTCKTRLPKFNGKWEKINLGELFQFKNGLNKAKKFFGYGTPIVNYMDVFKHPTIKPSMLEGRVHLTREEIQNFDVRKGDVFFTRTSETTDEIGMAAVMIEDVTDTVFSGFLLRARPKTARMCDAFKAYCFASKSVRNQIVATASYTTRALTNGKLLSQVFLYLPRKAEQIAIATALSDMDAEIAALEMRRNKTRAIKQGMMQQLLTGRIRLVKPQSAEVNA